MLLRIAEPGHPTRCGFGNSRDRPRASRSNIRFSSRLNSCSFGQNALLSNEVTSQRQVSLPRGICASHCSPPKPSLAPTEESTQLTNCVAKSQLGLRFSQVEMLCNFTARSIRTAEQPRPCGSTHPSFERLLEPESIAQGLGVPLNDAPASVGRGHRSKADSAVFPVFDAPFSEPG